MSLNHPSFNLTTLKRYITALLEYNFFVAGLIKNSFMHIVKRFIAQQKTIEYRFYNTSLYLRTYTKYAYIFIVGVCESNKKYHLFDMYIHLDADFCILPKKFFSLIPYQYNR